MDGENLANSWLIINLAKFKWHQGFPPYGTSIMKSPKKLKILEADIGILQSSQCPMLGTLKEVKDIEENQRITISEKILS